MRSLPAILALLLLAAPAQASTLVTEESTTSDRAGPYTIVTYVLTGTPGADAVDVARDGRDLVFRDPGGIETDAAGCTRADAATVRCAHAAARVLRADLGAGDDRIRFPGLPGSTIDGGDGADRLEGTEATFLGGPGDDALLGGEGSDDMDGGPGADVLDPGTGPGSDRLSYVHRTAGVRIDAGGDAAAGEPGEGDAVRPGFEFVTTGAGPDHVISAPGGTWIESRAGDDRLEGGPGFDRLETGDGADVAYGRGGYDEIFGDDDFKTPGRDHLDGGAGPDYVYGSAGTDVIVGGPGRDELVGGRGADRVLARDGEADTVWCEEPLEEPRSPGRDRAEVDAPDFTGWCGEVARSGPGRTELLFAGERRARRRDRGTARALVACTGRRACRGTLTLHVTPRDVVGRVRFRVAPGGRATIRIPFRLRGRQRSYRAVLAARLRGRDDAGVLRRTELSFSRRR